MLAISRLWVKQIIFYNMSGLIQSMRGLRAKTEASSKNATHKPGLSTSFIPLACRLQRQDHTIDPH